jgi:hypothetical protein
MTKKHEHVHTSDLAIFQIPDDSSQPLEYRVIPHNLDGLRHAIGGGWIEIVRTPFMPLLGCSCRCVLVVDEEGLIKQTEYNERATVFYPHNPGIHGDAFLVGEGPDPEGELEFFSLPPAFRDYRGGRMAPPENREWLKN